MGRQSGDHEPRAPVHELGRIPKACSVIPLPPPSLPLSNSNGLLCRGVVEVVGCMYVCVCGWGGPAATPGAAAPAAGAVISREEP